MHKFTIVISLLLFMAGCHSSQLSLFEFGSLEEFVKKHGVPYTAPQSNHEICGKIVDSLIKGKPTNFTKEMYEYINSPDIVSLRFRNGEFIGMALNYVLQFKTETFFGATYLSIQYERKNDWAIVFYVQDGEQSEIVPITDILPREKIYAVEEQYYDIIEEAKKSMR